MTSCLTQWTRWVLLLGLASVSLTVLGTAMPGELPDPQEKPPPRAEDAPQRPELVPLANALGKRDWAAVEKAFRDLGPQASADVLTALLARPTRRMKDPDSDPNDFVSSFSKILTKHVEGEFSDDLESDPQARKKKEEIAKESRKYAETVLGIVKGPKAPKAQDPMQGVLGAEVAGSVKDFDHKDWLRVVQAYPYTPSTGAVGSLALQCLASARSPDAHLVLDDTLRFLQAPSRHFGLTDPDKSKCLRSVLLLHALHADSAAWPYFPSARVVSEWSEEDARVSGIQKADVVPLYLSRWGTDKGALLSTPLEDVLSLLASDFDDDYAELAEGIAEFLLRSYRASLDKSKAIAAVVAKRPAVASMLRESATKRASHEFANGFEALGELLKTRLKSGPLDESKNPDLLTARQAFREASIATLVAHFLARSLFDGAEAREQKLAIAEKATNEWLSLCTLLLKSNEELNDPKKYPTLTKDRYEVSAEDLKILVRVAKREAADVGILLEVEPASEMVLLLPPSTLSRFRVMRGKLLSMECRYNEVLEHLNGVAKAQATSDATRIAENALDSWVLPAQDAGRSPAARTRMGDQTPTDFGQFVAELRKIPDLKLDESKVMKAFGQFCSTRRPLKKADMEAVLLPSVPDAPESAMRPFVAQLLLVLGTPQDASAKAREAERVALLGDDKKKADAAKAASAAASEAQETSEEYKALDAIVADWRKQHATWVGALLHADVQFAWCRHQLEYVDKFSLGTKTDVGGYSRHLEESMRLLVIAGDLCPQSKKGPHGEYESLELLRSWFQKMYVAAAERDTRATHEEEILAQLRGWLSRLPEEERTAIRRALVQHLLRQLFTPDEGTGYAVVRDVQIYYFVEGAVAVLGDLPEAAEFTRLQAGYRGLKESIHFHVVPDGTLYRDGLWVGDQKRTFAVGKGEFGVWLTLQHTAAARARSGGFRRYAQNQIENPGTALDARAAANYAKDMKARLEQYLAGVYTIVHIEPLPQAEPLRQRGGVNGEWQETPLYFMILKPASSVPVTSIPPLPLDLNFSDRMGLVVLPFRSESVNLDTMALDPAARQGITVKQRLLLNPRNVAEGLVTLEITTTGRMVPPPPEELFSQVCSPGFEKDVGRSTEEIKVAFQKGSTSAEVKRITTVVMRWTDLAGETEFRFPTGPADVKIERFVWSPDSALGESEGQAVPGETWRIRNLPRGSVPWSSLAWGSGGVAVLVLLGWGGWRFARRPRRVPPPPKFTMPSSLTTLRTIRLLRQLADNHEIRFSKEERARIEADTRKLEGEALTANGEVECPKEVAVVLQRWIQAANKASIHATSAK